MQEIREMYVEGTSWDGAGSRREMAKKQDSALCGLRGRWLNYDRENRGVELQIGVVLEITIAVRSPL